jgi:hypothetical protein
MAIIGLTKHPLVLALTALWGVSQSVSSWVDGHIDDMRGSKNGTIAATGKVLEAAKFGFGLGYITPFALTMMGQLILGAFNDTNAVVTAANLAMTAGSAVTFTNPVAVTCGAIGAIFFGWIALSDDEKNALISRVTEALEVGAELVRAMVDFLIRTMKSIFSEENMAELKRMLKSAAETIGRTLSDITKSILDAVVDGANAVKRGVDQAADAVGDALGAAGDAISETYEDLKDRVTRSTSESNGKSDKVGDHDKPKNDSKRAADSSTDGHVDERGHDNQGQAPSPKTS